MIQLLQMDVEMKEGQPLASAPVKIGMDRGNSDDEEDKSVELDGWADVPPGEQLDVDCAAPCAKHLLAMPPSYP